MDCDNELYWMTFDFHLQDDTYNTLVCFHLPLLLSTLILDGKAVTLSLPRESRLFNNPANLIHSELFGTNTLY